VHNAGRGARYTRSRRPVRLAYWETQPSPSAALRREAELKRLPRARKLALCLSANSEVMENRC
jgi:putative endonuclease